MKNSRGQKSANTMSKAERKAARKPGRAVEPVTPVREQEPEETGSVMRLQKFLARAGVASRRAAEVLISEGRVTINGAVADKLGTKVDAEVDVVCVDGKVIAAESVKVTLMLNKPAGYVTTMSDPQGRPCVAELVPTDEYPSLYPLGRLDRDTSGLLLFSTDGELGNALLHPSKHVDKTYITLVEGVPSETSLMLMREGLPLEDGMTAPAKVEVLTGEAREAALAEIGSVDEEGVSGVNQRHGGNASRANLEASGTVLAITIHEGRNRQVRRMCAMVGNPCIALHRRSFANLNVNGLEKGAWRLLTDEEISALRASVVR